MPTSKLYHASHHPRLLYHHAWHDIHKHRTLTIQRFPCVRMSAPGMHVIRPPRKPCMWCVSLCVGEVLPAECCATCGCKHGLNVGLGCVSMGDLFLFPSATPVMMRHAFACASKNGACRTSCQGPWYSLCVLVCVYGLMDETCCKTLR